MQQQISNWKPRVLTIGKDIPESGECDDYIFNTPERTAVEFMNYWKKKNYGYIAKQLYISFKSIKPEKEEIKEIRRILENTGLIEYKIVSITDKAPAICEVNMNVKYKYQEITIEQNITLRHICQRENGDASMFGDDKGHWYYINTFLYDIECKCIQAIIGK